MPTDICYLKALSKKKDNPKPEILFLGLLL